MTRKVACPRVALLDAPETKCFGEAQSIEGGETDLNIFGRKWTCRDAARNEKRAGMGAGVMAILPVSSKVRRFHI